MQPETVANVEALSRVNTSRLSPSEQVVLRAIAQSLDDGVSSPSAASLGFVTGLSSRTVRRAIDRLDGRAISVDRSVGAAHVYRLTLDRMSEVYPGQNVPPPGQNVLPPLDKMSYPPDRLSGVTLDNLSGVTLDRMSAPPDKVSTPPDNLSEVLRTRARSLSEGERETTTTSSSPVGNRSDEEAEVPCEEVPRLTLVASTPEDGGWVPGPRAWTAMVEANPHLDVSYQRLLYIGYCNEKKREASTAGFAQWLSIRERQAVESAQREKDLAAGRAMPSWGCDNNMKPIAWGAQ